MCLQCCTTCQLGIWATADNCVPSWHSCPSLFASSRPPEEDTLLAARLVLLCIHELLPLKGSNSVQQSLLIGPHLFQMLMQHNNALIVSSRAQLATAQQFELSSSAAMQRYRKQADLIRLQPLSSHQRTHQQCRSNIVLHTCPLWQFQCIHRPCM